MAPGLIFMTNLETTAKMQRRPFSFVTSANDSLASGSVSDRSGGARKLRSRPIYISPFNPAPSFGRRAAGVTDHAWLGAWPAWIPKVLMVTPALLILWAPGGFRFTLLLLSRRLLQSFLG